MFRFLVQDIYNKAASDLPQFATVKLFNDHFFNQDEGVIDSFRFPALFISFPDGADFVNNGSGVQKATEFTVRFHIADQLTESRLSMNKTELEVFDLKQAVYSVFQGMNSPGNYSAFERVHEEPDEDRTNYYVYLQDYRLTLHDTSKNIAANGQEVTLGLDLDTDLIINPATKQDGNGIRTAKDVNDG